MSLAIRIQIKMSGDRITTKTALATALAKCDDEIQPVARRPLVDIRFYLDPDTGLPHIYGHGSRRKRSSRFCGPRGATPKAVGGRG